LIPFTIGISQSYSLEEAIEIALENKEALKTSALDLQSSRQGVNFVYNGEIQ